MKRIAIYFLFLLAFSNVCLSEEISEFRGFDDSEGNTHIYYRVYSTTPGYGFGDGWDDPVFHYSISDTTDTLFLRTGCSAPLHPYDPISCHIVQDYEFWNNNPNEYIYGYPGNGCMPEGFIMRYDSELEDEWENWVEGVPNNIEISSQNDSLLYCATEGYSYLYKSIDGGHTWNLHNEDFPGLWIKLSPFDDQIMFTFIEDFGTRYGYLYQSMDGGNNFTLVDTTDIWNYWSSPRKDFKFDTDQSHIYAVNRHYEDGSNTYYFMRSANGGASWETVFTNENEMYLSLDGSTSGTLYLTDGNIIKISTDYGETFNDWCALEVDEAIVGIYKKPNSDYVYVATSTRIYEVSDQELVTLKELETNIADTNFLDIPQKSVLLDNYPNPFNPNTTIGFQLPESTRHAVTLRVYDVSGKLVKTLIDGEMEAGYHSVVWDGKDDARQDVASGVYFYRMDSSSYRETKSMLLLK